MSIGVDEQGRWPLPWLQGAMASAQALSQAHAVLAHGPVGVGHLEFALLLAQRNLCEDTARPPCGRCASCRLVRNRAHPDLLIVLPDALRAALGWIADDGGAEPKSDAKPSKDIRVQQIRQAIDWARNTSARGRGKVMVVHSADALNLTAANALLKTLEEPPGTLRLVLTSVDPDRLLPTVRSRCQRLAMHLPDAALSLQWLAEQGVEQPAELLALAGSSAMQALALAEEGIQADWCRELPGRVAAGDAALLRGRPVPRVIELLSKLAHDAMAVAVGGSPRFYAAGAVPAGADLAACAAWQRSLIRAARHDEHPWQAALLIEALVTEATRVWPARVAATPARGSASLHSRP